MEQHKASLISLVSSSESLLSRRSTSDCGVRSAEFTRTDLLLLCVCVSQLELQASYDEAVQELRGLEVEREALLFQVDVLQDSLEGVEELLAEAQREAGQASLVRPSFWVLTVLKQAVRCLVTLVSLCL